ncbi:MAG: HlyD family type I secretion periplasmic adaptor subunit [Hydrotalea sp.]|nr:HlyD family type I secretion periplasmic adaptor subunit [Hydrotalea sp.]
MFDPNMVRPKPAGRDRDIVLGSVTIVVGLLIFFIWAFFSPLHEGVMAQGTIVVEGQRKVIQHLEGGIVKNILVKEGDTVKTNDVLVEMEGTQSRANFDIVTGRYESALAQVTRLTATYSNQPTLVFPNELLQSAKTNKQLQSTLTAQQEIFKAYREQYANQVKIYQERLAGLISQQRAKQSYLGGIKKELINLQSLERDRLVDHATVIARQRDYEETNSDINRLGSDIASTQLSLSQIKIDSLEKISRELAEAQKEMNDLKAQRDNLADVVSRIEIRSPVDGKILRLAITGAGQVVPPGGALMEIVPIDDKLVIHAMVNATDRPGLVEGQKVRVSFPSLKSRVLPTIYGTLNLISADVIQNPNAAPTTSIQANKVNPSSFYSATISVTPEELKKLDDNKLDPGMPVTVMIEGKKRTPMAYFLKPFSGLWDEAFIEK